MSGIKNVLITAGLNFGIFGYTAWNNGKSSKGPHRSTSELFKIYEVKPDMQSEDRMVEARQRVVPPALSQWLRGSKSSSVYLEVV
jgi:hypothetical protein